MSLGKKYIISHDPFPQDLVPVLDLPRVTNEDGTRFYTTPQGKRYPSITTVLGALNPVWLSEWRARVGTAAANKISSRAMRRGTRIHELFENLLRQGTIDLSKDMPDVRQMVRDTVPLLNHINKVVAIEAPLYSDSLQLAGTTDLVAEWDNELSVVDYKNSNHLKKRDDILNYFAQCAGYATMFEERYGMPINQIVIIVAVEGFLGQVFVEHPKDHRAYLQNAIDSYWDRYAEQQKTTMDMG
jgi:genome maintenance exonuclease 1